MAASLKDVHSAWFFIVALSLLCRFLESIGGIKPHLYAHKLKPVSGHLMPCLLLLVSNTYILAKCVFLSACLAVRRDMRKLIISGVADHWKSELLMLEILAVTRRPLSEGGLVLLQVRQRKTWSHLLRCVRCHGVEGEPSNLANHIWAFGSAWSWSFLFFLKKNLACLFFSAGTVL